MVFAADTLKDILFTNWSLGGTLSKTELDNMKEIVQFFAWPQIRGNEVSKAVTVQKMNAETNEKVVEHPTFNEVSDVYEITVFYRTTDVQLISREEAFSDVESMTDEVVRILKTVYNPATGIGIYFSAGRNWIREDDYNTDQPDLRRRLIFTLTTIQSEDDEVFTGVNGLLVYDRSQTNADNPPGSDYIYTEVNEVESNGGFRLIPRLTRENPGIAKRASGMFQGRFVFDTMAKASDLTGSTNNLINQIDLLQSSGELAEVYLIKRTFNQAGQTMNHTTRMQIINKVCQYTREDLARFRLTGEVIEPPTITVT